MRLTKIELNGYKRFEATECNVDGRAIAFIGPNEAGKTSLLAGLEWLTVGGELKSADCYRPNPPPAGIAVVRAHFILDKHDADAVAKLDLDMNVKAKDLKGVVFRFSRQKSGSPMSKILLDIVRDMSHIEGASSALSAAADELSAKFEDEDSNPDWVQRTLTSLRGARAVLEDRVSDWEHETHQEPLAAHSAALREVAGELAAGDHGIGHATRIKRLNKAADLVDRASSSGSKPEPDHAIRSLLIGRRPEFVLFSDDERLLRPTYELSHADVRDDPPRPLANLLAVAGTTVDAVWEAVQTADSTVYRSLRRSMNERLAKLIKPMWKQSKLTVQIDINHDGLLEVNIKELDSPDRRVTSIEERSDGFRAFLGLVCFLLAKELDAPPVLLIDEAERNLHYDAQGDLIRVITKELKIAKVLYTTHSPGCLPLDLGRGIRVVQRLKGESKSTLQNNFWTASEPGFSRLLYSMGAQVAAFSEIKHAVLTEGPSEMILLPTLLRNSTNGSELDFQVAFGLSNMRLNQVVGEVALVTTFLLDGDGSGDSRSRGLVKIGIPESHIFHLPAGRAIEDLVPQDVYLAAVDEVLAESGHTVKIDPTKLKPGLTIAKAVDVYLESLPNPPSAGHKVVASKLAEIGDRLKPTPEGKVYLAELRRSLEQAFKVTYLVKEPTEEGKDTHLH